MAESGEAEESGISMVEVLQEEEERQLNAAAVLGAADDTQCTYDQVSHGFYLHLGGCSGGHRGGLSVARRR